MPKDNDSFGGGFYPELLESEYKCFKFTALVEGKICGYVWAKNEEEALDLIKNKAWDDLDDEEFTNVEEILDLQEEN